MRREYVAYGERGNRSFFVETEFAVEDLILDVAQVNPNVIVVIYAGSAVDVSAFEGKVKAILYMGYCGEGANEAGGRSDFGEGFAVRKTWPKLSRKALKIRLRRIGAATAIQKDIRRVFSSDISITNIAGLRLPIRSATACRIRRFNTEI